MRTIIHNIYIIRYILVLLTGVFALTGCDVHEFPEASERVRITLHLNFATDWEVQEEIVSKQRSLPICDMRYIIKAFPAGTDDYAHAETFTFLRSARDGYDCSFTIDIPEGRYDIRVWSDLVEPGMTDDRFYGTADFARISLIGEHCGNTDERDAFRGTCPVELVSTIKETLPAEYTVEMVRPLAKFEFITTDLDEFINKVVQETEAAQGRTGTDTDSRSVISRVTEDYRVVFYYTGFMPDVFSHISDKPVDSSTGVSFTSTIEPLNEKEASLGFDHVFINTHNTTVQVAVGLTDADGKLLFVSNPVDVPIRRSYHTIVRGRFLTQQAAGGVVIDPDFDDDINIVLP